MKKGTTIKAVESVDVKRENVRNLKAEKFQEALLALLVGLTCEAEGDS